MLEVAGKGSLALVLLWSAVWASIAGAQEESILATESVDTAESPDTARDLQIHGFVSQGFIKSTEHDYLGPSERGSVEFTEAAINFTKPISDDLRVGLQIFAHDLGPIGNYKPQFDWYYIDYRFWDWLGIRMGRTKIPFGLYNEVNDIDAARVPILLPQSVYPASSRDVSLAQTGGELYGYVPLSAAGALEYRAYGGTIFVDPETLGGGFTGLNVPYMFGGRLMWSPPIEGLEVGGSLQRVRLELDFIPTAEQRAAFEMANLLPAGSSGSIPAGASGWLWVASAQYQMQGLLLAAEYGRYYTDSDPTVLGPGGKDQSTRLYVMGSYGVADWFTPGAYYAFSEPDIKARSGPSSYQHDVAVTLRFDINANWLVKVEGHYMHGLAGLDPASNGAVLISDLNGRQEDWGVLLLKTTAYY